MRKLWLIAGCAGLCCSWIALAPSSVAAAQDEQQQQQTPAASATAGDAPSTQPGAGGGGLRRMGPGPFGGGGQGGMRMFNPEDREAIYTFAREHMKNLYQVMTDTPFPQQRGRRRALMVFANTRMKALEQVKNDEALTARVTRNIEAEDELFKYVQDLEKASTEQDRTVAREKIRTKIREIVDNFLSERSDRIEKLKAKLSDEEQKLKEDQGNRDQLVDKRVNNFLREFTRDLGPDDGPDQTNQQPPSQQSPPAAGTVTASPDAPPPAGKR